MRRFRWKGQAFAGHSPGKGQGRESQSSIWCAAKATDLSSLRGAALRGRRRRIPRAASGWRLPRMLRLVDPRRYIRPAPPFDIAKNFLCEIMHSLLPWRQGPAAWYAGMPPRLRAGRHRARGTGRRGRPAPDHRGVLPARHGGTRPRPLRGAVLAWRTSAHGAVHGRRRLPGPAAAAITPATSRHARLVGVAQAGGALLSARIPPYACRSWRAGT